MSKRKPLWLCLRQSDPWGVSYQQDRVQVLVENTIRNDTRLRSSPQKPNAIIVLSPHWLTAIPTPLKTTASREAKQYAIEPYLVQEEEPVCLFSRKHGDHLCLYVAQQEPLQKAIQALSLYVDIEALYLEQDFLTEAQTLYLYPNPSGCISVILPTGQLYLSNSALLRPLLKHLAIDQQPIQRIVWIGQATVELTEMNKQVHIYPELPLLELPKRQRPNNEWPALRKQLPALSIHQAHERTWPSWNNARATLIMPYRRLSLTVLGIMALVSVIQCGVLAYTTQTTQTQYHQLMANIATDRSHHIDALIQTWQDQAASRGLMLRTDALPMLTVAAYARLLAQLPPPDQLSYDTNTLRFQWTQFMPSTALERMKAVLQEYGYQGSSAISLRGLTLTITAEWASSRQST